MQQRVAARAQGNKILFRIFARMAPDLGRRVSWEMDPVRRTEHERRTHNLFRGAALVCAARFCSEECASGGKLFHVSKLVSTPVQAETVAEARRELAGALSCRLLSTPQT
jgi:hypothetical protein